MFSKHVVLIIIGVLHHWNHWVHLRLLHMSSTKSHQTSVMTCICACIKSLCNLTFQLRIVLIFQNWRVIEVVLEVLLRYLIQTHVHICLLLRVYKLLLLSKLGLLLRLLLWNTHVIIYLYFVSISIELLLLLPLIEIIDIHSLNRCIGIVVILPKRGLTPNQRIWILHCILVINVVTVIAKCIVAAERT